MLTLPRVPTSRSRHQGRFMSRCPGSSTSTDECAINRPLFSCADYLSVRRTSLPILKAKAVIVTSLPFATYLVSQSFRLAVRNSLPGLRRKNLG